MPHHGEVNGDLYSPRSQFYQGPYGRMFRNLPPYVPAIDLIIWLIIEGKLSDASNLLFGPEVLSEPFQNYQVKWLIDKLEFLQLAEYKSALSEAERAILRKINDAIHNVNTLSQTSTLSLKGAEITEARRNSETLVDIMQRLEDCKIGDQNCQPQWIIEHLLRAFREALLGIQEKLKDKVDVILTNLEKLLQVYRGHQIEEGLNPPLERRADPELIKLALEDSEEGREAILELLARTLMTDIFINDSIIDILGENTATPAGYTYFLQYITHDITFDPTSSLMRFNDPDKIRNFRTPHLDLDSLYGNGPDVSPFMYNYDPYGSKRNDLNQKYFLLVGKGGERDTEEDDLPRNTLGRALIGDPRNDEHLILSQMHLAFIKFHNRVLQDLIDQGLKGQYAFQEAQRLVRWHYQWVILCDFLPRFVDDDILKEIFPSFYDPETPKIFPTLLNYQKEPKLRYYCWRNQPFIPIEFSVAAFRFGHSMIRNEYIFNGIINVSTNIIPTDPAAGEDTHLLGFRKLRPRWTVQWDLFLQITDDVTPQTSRKIDTNLSTQLRALPFPLEGLERRSLATRDLMRGYKMGLPSGQAIARAMGEESLDGPEAPLWYYILREAEEEQQGLKLGPVGGRIVAEVIIGLLSGDPHSFINVDPKWRPTIYSSMEKDFELRDIFHHAKVPLTKEAIEQSLI